MWLADRRNGNAVTSLERALKLEALSAVQRAVRRVSGLTKSRYWPFTLGYRSKTTLGIRPFVLHCCIEGDLLPAER